jgi:predicted nucleic-acid-binding protein
MPTLDTNCLLRWLVRDDPVATARMDRLTVDRDSLRVLDVALIESVFVMESHYRFTRSEVAQAVRLVMGQAVFELDRPLWAGVMEIYLDHPKLSVVDIFLSVHADHRGGAPLLTFDKKLISQLGATRP